MTNDELREVDIVINYSGRILTKTPLKTSDQIYVQQAEVWLNYHLDILADKLEKEIMSKIKNRESFRQLFGVKEEDK